MIRVVVCIFDNVCKYTFYVEYYKLKFGIFQKKQNMCKPQI